MVRPGLGFADAQRIGNDVEGQWKGLEPTLRCAGPVYWANGNLWWNDPDQLHLGGSVDNAGKLRGLPLDQARAWAALVTLYGSVPLAGDWTTNGPAVRRLNLADLQYKPKKRLCIFDFWSGKLLPAESGAEMLEVEAFLTRL